MKTLLIVGTYVFNDAPQTIKYNVVLYGQTDDFPEITYITTRIISARNHASLISECKKVYCKYFNVDDWNIVTLDWITKQGNPFVGI